MIGHRGACGYLPEHTIESYRLALALGADVVETDIVLTRDAIPICRHDCELSVTTDVAEHLEFAARKTSRVIDGVESVGWFAQDFTLEEILTLRARQRFAFRDKSFDDVYAIPSLMDLLKFISGAKTRAGAPAGLIIEMKHAAYFDSIGLPIDQAISRALTPFGGQFPCWIECFEIDILKRLHEQSGLPLIQLLGPPDEVPPDVSNAKTPLTYGQMIAPDGLADICAYAVAIGAWKGLIVPPIPSASGQQCSLPPTSLVRDAHAAGLDVHAWTFRSERQFLAREYGGDPTNEYRQFRALGVDGFITDFPDAASKALNLPRHRPPMKT